MGWVGETMLVFQIWEVLPSHWSGPLPMFGWLPMYGEISTLRRLPTYRKTSLNGKIPYVWPAFPYMGRLHRYGNNKGQR